MESTSGFPGLSSLSQKQVHFCAPFVWAQPGGSEARRQQQAWGGLSGVLREAGLHGSKIAVHQV